MTRHLFSAYAAVLLLAGSASAQQKATITGVPEIPFTSVPNFLKLPAGQYSGRIGRRRHQLEGQHLRLSPPRHDAPVRIRQERHLHQGNRQGLLRLRIRALGPRRQGRQHLDGGRRHEPGHQVQPRRQGADGDRPQAAGGRWPRASPPGPNPPAQKYILCRPSDVGFDPQGNIFISDGYCNNRVVKYDKNGRFVAQVGSEKAGKELGEFNLPHGLQVDGRGHVWVADRTNNRYQELDNDLKPIKEITNLGTGWTLCISGGPHQYVFFSNSNPNGNPPGSWQNTGEIYKAELDGTVLGKFGKPGKIAPGFQVVHKIDCRNPNELILGEIESWRVQKYILQPTPPRTAAGERR